MCVRSCGPREHNHGMPRLVSIRTESLHWLYSWGPHDTEAHCLIVLGKSSLCIVSRNNPQCYTISTALHLDIIMSVSMAYVIQLNMLLTCLDYHQ